MNEAEILEQSPFLEGYEEKPVQMAFYSVNCCWWTSFPDDLGSTKDFMAGKVSIYTTGENGKKEKHVFENQGIPCCPHCGSVLLQAPLIEFISAAKTAPLHYGKYELRTFFASHERNSKSCFRRWEHYDILIAPFGKDGKK